MMGPDESSTPVERPEVLVGGAAERVRALVDEYRSRCLWFLKPDYYPATADEVSRALAYVERYGDRVAYVKVGELRQWLSLHSSGTSAGS